MRFLYMRKIILSISIIIACLLTATGQQTAALTTTGCMLCQKAKLSAVDLYWGGDHKGYKPPHHVDPWGKVMNFYKPNGDEAGDREGFNIHELGRKQIYFGIALGVNVANYKIVRKPLTGIDTIKTVTAGIGPGFNLGIIGNWQFSKYFDLRFIPTLSFADRNIKYTTILRQHPDTTLPVSSIYLDFPLQLRFKSDPIKNVRVYVIAGIRYDYDLASNSSARTSSILKVDKTDLAAEYGIGLMIYFPYFIMSPELKVSQGLLNINSPTQGLIYSTVIQKLYSRTFTFTLNLEG
jgi:hypothetical protein